MKPVLEAISQSMEYGNLPETWQVQEIGRFSLQKTLYDYQRLALENTARALYLYYGHEDNDWQAHEAQDSNGRRKKHFESLYRIHDNPLASLALKKYERRVDARNQIQNQVFRILSDFIASQGDIIPYSQLINRMCFWMATGSGKTLVMVKLIEYLHFLKQHGEIPPHNFLILAPSEHLIGQIQRTVDEFNQNGLYIALVPLRDIHRSRQQQIGDVATVYYHRSDNIADVQKDALTDYRTYENGGRWYVLLDEAHKGGKEESKRQAYYAIMAREGFLFNFSATFTDKEDIVTTVKKYNLEEFIKNGHGKNIYLNEGQYDAFMNIEKEISPEERRKIVLQSLITLAYVSLRVAELRKKTGLGDDLYHQPLMLTLVNTVSTSVKNDLWAFFQILHEIATGEIDESLFKASKDELISDWSNAQLLFGEDGRGIIGTDEALIRKMTIPKLRAAVFLSKSKGAIQFISSRDNKELAFQMKNASSPFALMRIGDTSKWRTELLDGYHETTALQEKSFFEKLERSPITILMGSRSFFESWDSNRPNVINFINIGGREAKKFVVQSVGRGVRIETLPHQRRRFAYLPDSGEKKMIQDYHAQVQPPETLFLFATNRNAIKTVLEGLETEKAPALRALEGFEIARISKLGNKNMPLLIPEYREDQDGSVKAPFSMSKETLQRFKAWIEKTSDAVFMVRDGLTAVQITTLRDLVKTKSDMVENIRENPEKNYAQISFLQTRLISHLSKTVKLSDGVREVTDEDIVHFRQIRVDSEYAQELQEKINQVKQGRVSNHEIAQLALQLGKGEINRAEFDRRSSGKDEDIFKNLEIKRLLNHYYFPVILGDEASNYIQHIIKVQSEIKFLNALEQWTGTHVPPWDAWMFSKIDASLDDVHLPYYDRTKNEYRRFLPDFVFWMCRRRNNKNEYQIVFVDPKGEEHTAAYHKIDGYKKLFENEEDEKIRLFEHGMWDVSVKLLFYNPDAKPLRTYRDYWIKDPGHIFAEAE